jgi:hypothetical protein
MYLFAAFDFNTDNHCGERFKLLACQIITKSKLKLVNGYICSMAYRFSSPEDVTDAVSCDIMSIAQMTTNFKQIADCFCET